MVQTEIKFCEENFAKNKDGKFIYISDNGKDKINLPFILSWYKDWLIENSLIEEK